MAPNQRRSSNNNARTQVIFFITCVTILTNFLTPTALAVNGSNQVASETAAAQSSSQPLWSYQVKPTSQYNLHPNGHHQPNVMGNLNNNNPGGSLFDAFQGLSQRQGALTSSPLMSILPIILIAAGGLLLLLPMLTMMMASPFGAPGGGGLFGGAGAGGYQNFGYPQANLLSKRRSLDSQRGGGGGGGLIELIEHVSSTIEDLSKHYGGVQNKQSRSGQQQKRVKAAGTESSEASQVVQPPPANHKLEDGSSSSSSSTQSAINTSAGL